MQFGSDRTVEVRQVALLYLPVAILPVARENWLLRVVQDAFAAQVVERYGDAFAQFIRRQRQLMGKFLNPRQRGVQAVVVHL